MQPLTSCGMLVFRDKPVVSFLLMRHADRLDLPKGHVDPGESELECAMRELQEETGVAAEDIELDSEFRFVHKYTVRYERTDHQAREKTLIIFLGRLKREVKIELSEHIGFEWIAWNPPHSIQPQTIDPLLAEVAQHLDARG